MSTSSTAPDPRQGIRAEISDFLRTRRDTLSPQAAGIIAGSRRRVPGLRREELAMLAGMSVDYYARMERGDLAGVSPEVLDALARGLQLDEAETDHLHDLAEAAQPRPRRPRRAASPTVRPALQQFLDAAAAPMWARDRRMDVLATNALGRALYAPLLEDVAARGNTARFLFLSPASRVFFPDWERSADGVVATLRSYAGQTPRDTGLTDLIGELIARSEEFSTRWSAHHVRHHRTGTKRIHHPQVGDLELSYEGMELSAEEGWTLFGYSAEPGSPSAERLALLASLAVSPSESPESSGPSGPSGPGAGPSSGDAATGRGRR